MLPGVQVVIGDRSLWMITVILIVLFYHRWCAVRPSTTRTIFLRGCCRGDHLLKNSFFLLDEARKTAGVTSRTSWKTEGVQTIPRWSVYVFIKVRQKGTRMVPLVFHSHLASLRVPSPLTSLFCVFSGKSGCVISSVATRVFDCDSSCLSFYQQLQPKKNCPRFIHHQDSFI